MNQGSAHEYPRGMPRRALLSLLVLGACAPAPRERVVLITLDTCRADALASMPLTAAFAERGARFTEAFAATSTTQPTHASLLTGLHPWQHGVTANGAVLPETAATVPEALQAAGFATGAVVASFPLVRRFGFAQGFQRFHDELEVVYARQWEGETVAGGRFLTLGEAITDRALALLEELEGPKQFLWVHYFDAHDPYGDAAGEPNPMPVAALLQAGREARSDLPELVEHARALYVRDLGALDRAVGRLLARLAEDDGFVTHVVLTADHGESLGEHQYYFEHGEYLYDGTLRIPLIVKFPHDRHKGLRVAGKTMIFDVMPTILAAAGGQLHDVAGTDLAVGLEGAREPHPLIYGETDRVFFPENPRRYVDGIAGNWKSVREGRLKLIEIPHPDGNLYELYDIVADPEEKANLYRTGHPDAERLTVALRQWLASFDGGEAASPRPLEIDEQTAERLRRLGYMNE